MIQVGKEGVRIWKYANECRAVLLDQVAHAHTHVWIDMRRSPSAVVALYWEKPVVAPTVFQQPSKDAPNSMQIRRLFVYSFVVTCMIIAI